MSDAYNLCLWPRSSLIFFATAALSLIPSNAIRYGGLAVIIVSLLVDVANRSRPSVRLVKLRSNLASATTLLSSAMSEHAPNVFELDKIHVELLQTSLSVSQIRSDLLDTDTSPLKSYLPKMRSIWLTFSQCEEEMEKIQRSILLSMESENRRKLAQDISAKGSSGFLLDIRISRTFSFLTLDSTGKQKIITLE
ncbi:hypothetical protein R3P38DRAFT_2791628 [Favolaschia claudopus]|uniref:ATP synthase protein MI25 n=1 Tax=Favolaschia claudopus TaxID=2862362 RepID=A0AAW0AIL6_9AGAR